MDYYDDDYKTSKGRWKKTGIFFLGILPGMVVGGALAWYVLPRDGEPNIEQTNQTPAAVQDKEGERTGQLGQENNVERMTLSEMTAALRQSPDGDFERQYLVYAIQLGNYTTAINRIAKERAERAELKQFAEVYHDTSDELTRQLFDWQSAWGHTDH